MLMPFVISMVLLEVEINFHRIQEKNNTYYSVFYAYFLLGDFMEYVVKKGDTLYGIGKQFGVSVPDLIDANQLTNSSLKIGQILKIPIDDDSSYVVQKGDTLYSISKKYGIPVAELMEMNHLTSQILSIGQILDLSNDSHSSSNYYVVQKGDTLYSIAKKYNLSVSDLISFNQLMSTTLTIGQTLSLSPVSDIVMGSTCFGQSYEEPQYITHIVKRGDTLYSIAKKYGVSVDSILKLNDLSNASLSIGQILKIQEVS